MTQTHVNIEHANGTVGTHLSTTTCVHFRFYTRSTLNLTAAGSSDAVTATAAVVRQVLADACTQSTAPDSPVPTSPISIASSIQDLTELEDEYDYDNVDALYEQQSFLPSTGVLPTTPASTLEITLLNVDTIEATLTPVTETTAVSPGEPQYIYSIFNYDIACHF